LSDKADSAAVEKAGLSIVRLSKELLDQGKNSEAKSILLQTRFSDAAIETERQFLLARSLVQTGDIYGAIAIFREILDRHPNLARVRFELARAYIATEQWYRADYHLRLAMAGENLPEEARQMMYYLRYVVRQNKNWNAWFNFGVAPDNNINTAAGGEECVMTMFGLMCRQLPEPEKAIGYNFVVGGNYEFKLSDNWRWKSDANIYTNMYDKSKYDDLYLSASTGPRYVFQSGDVWLAGIGARRWYGWKGYNRSAGAKLDANYDFTRKLSGGLFLRALENTYDELGDYLDGETYGASVRLSYSIDATKYLIFRVGLDRDNTVDPIYSNWRPSIGAGFGIELPAGFNVYLDASVYWQKYDGGRWIVKDGAFAQVAERDFTQRYAASVSNNKLSIWDFVPTLTFSYTKRDSNIWQREFEKWELGFSMHQRF
jgi:hypothetical protein